MNTSDIDIGRLSTRIAIAWKDVVINELADELRSLTLRHRALAMQYIFERCRRYAFPKVTKLLESEKLIDEVRSNNDRSVEFLFLARYVLSEKYLSRIIKQIRDLIPLWREGKEMTMQDWYNELYPRKESLGDHDDCGGEVIVSGSYFRCRSCKSVGHEVRETEDHTLLLLLQQE